MTPPPAPPTKGLRRDPDGSATLYGVPVAVSWSYDNRIFRAVANAAHGEASESTLFHYHQNGAIVWADYAGGDIVLGHLVATMADDGSLNMRYHHVNRAGALMTGVCRSTPEVLPDGRLRLHEDWHWTCGDGSSGHSVVEEIAP